MNRLCRVIRVAFRLLDDELLTFLWGMALRLLRPADESFLVCDEGAGDLLCDVLLECFGTGLRDADDGRRFIFMDGPGFGDGDNLLAFDSSLFQNRNITFVIHTMIPFVVSKIQFKKLSIIHVDCFLVGSMLEIVDDEILETLGANVTTQDQNSTTEPVCVCYAES